VGSFFFLFTVLPFVELWLLVRMGRLVGAPVVLAYVITMIFVGSWLARSQGRRVLAESRAALEQGRVPEGGLLGSVMILLGGVLLIVPGVITDVLGLLCLIPLTRRTIGAQLQKALAARVAQGSVRVEHFDLRNRANGDVIDTEGEDVTDRDPRLR
jgi:UPF0716 protein FxsA